MASEADLLGLGEHCSVGSCRQIDFLPFTCDCCKRVFCLEHRTYEAHSCPSAGSRATTLIVCPLCAKAVHLTPGQDPNVAFEAHQRAGCDPNNYNRVHKKPRCPVSGCKEKLATINTYRCKHCGQRICLKHRDPADHGCAEAQAANRNGARLGVTPSAAAASSSGRSSGTSSAASSRPPSVPPPARPSAPPAPAPTLAPPAPPAARRPDPQALREAARKQYDDPGNSVRGTAARRMQGGSNANPLVPPHRPEVCPQCGASFESVARLIQHVEDFHPATATAATAAAGAASGGQGGGAGLSVVNPLRSLLGSTTIAGGAAPRGAAPWAPPPQAAAGAGAAPGLLHSGAGGAAGEGGREVFRCYFCSQAFHDPVLLVQHADRCSAARAAAGTGAGAGAGGRGAAGGGGAGGSGASKDSCIIL